MKPIETARLRLRELAPEDAPFILSLLNDPDWIKNIGDRGVRTLEGAESYIVKGPVISYAKHGFGLWLVESPEGTPMGMCGLIKRDTLEDVDLGFAFMPPYRGKGYAREAAEASLRCAAMLGMARVVAIVSFQNADSIGLLTRLGFVFEKPITMPNDPEEIGFYGIALEKYNAGGGVATNILSR